MTPDYFEQTFDVLVTRRPFKPFTVELNSGQRYEIDHPGAAIWQGGHAVFRSPGGVLVFFDHESVNQIINSPAHAAPGKTENPNGN